MIDVIHGAKGAARNPGHNVCRFDIVSSQIGRIDCVIDRRSIIVNEADEAGVFDAIGFVRRHRKDDAFAQSEFIRETQLVVRVRPAVRMNRPGAEFDRRNVTLAGGAQAYDEAQPAGGSIALIRMRHDRRIKNRGGLQGVFAGKQGAAQQLPITGK